MKRETVALKDTLDAELDGMAAVLAVRWKLVVDGGAIVCVKCGERADPRMLHCGQCLLARYKHNYPGSEWQLWPALERILRGGWLDAGASRDLIRAASEMPTPRPDWIRLFESIVRARFAPDPDADWRTR